MPDVVSMNEKLSGLRREAIFYNLIAKIGTGFAQMGSNYSLSIFGYLNPSEQYQTSRGAIGEGHVSFIHYCLHPSPCAPLTGVVISLRYSCIIQRIYAQMITWNNLPRFL